jgi:hypothetical protein
MHVMLKGESIYLLRTTGMNKDDRMDILNKLQICTPAFRMFFAEFLVQERQANQRPIARPHLLHEQPMQTLWEDRDLWAWAAAWTLSTMHENGSSTLVTVCGMCGQVTGTTCDECGSPTCHKCYEQIQENKVNIYGKCWRCHNERDKANQRRSMVSKGPSPN